METKKSSSAERYLFWILLSGLLLLRFPWLIFGRFLVPGDDVVIVVYELGTCLLTCILIFLERERLAEYHVDGLALVLLLGAPIAVLVGRMAGGYALPGQEIKVVFAVILLVALLIRRPVLPRRGVGRTAGCIGAAVLAGAALAVVSAFVLSFQTAQVVDLSALPSAGRLLYGSLYQLDYAAAAEEPLFRGFLWGRLRKCGWKDHWIWLFQALLFAVGHAYYVGSSNISAFLAVPLGALALGLIAWKTRSVGASMIAHGITNGFGYTLSCVFYTLMR